jgi:hypothetical protein
MWEEDRDDDEGAALTVGTAEWARWTGDVGPGEGGRVGGGADGRGGEQRATCASCLR